MKHTHDELFRRVASRYVDTYGAQIKQETEQINLNRAYDLPPGMDARIRRRLRSRRTGRWIAGVAALAACVVLAVILPRMLDWAGSGAPAASSSAASSAAAASSSPASSSPSEYERLTLTFTLPANLTVADVDQDKARTIYYLDDANLDDVVLTLEQTDAAPDTEGLTPITINHVTVYGVSESDYSVITFQKDGILYVMTCKHDINTLVGLAKQIL